MNNVTSIYRLTGLLFAVTALVTTVGHGFDSGTATVWLCLTALFLTLGTKAKSR